jgi:hypothetical protein
VDEVGRQTSEEAEGSIGSEVVLADGFVQCQTHRFRRRKDKQKILKEKKRKRKKLAKRPKKRHKTEKAPYNLHE